jgi:DNA-directed RNA polymerase specialized sigma24 family protein
MALAWEEVDRAAPFAALDVHAVLRSARASGGDVVAEIVRRYEARLMTADVPDRFAAFRALAQLPTEDRICVLLSAVAEMRYGEVAQVLGIEAVAARQRITRAKARFRSAYEREGAHVAEKHGAPPR